MIEKKELAPLQELIERLTSIGAVAGSMGSVQALGSGSAATTPTSEAGAPTFQ